MEELEFTSRITATSQYKWRCAYQRPNLSPAKKDAEKALLSAVDIHLKILACAAKLPNNKVWQNLHLEGFIFDIFEAETGEMQLLEIHAFGAMSGCSSCLFHGIEDVLLLYGERREVEVRLAI